MLFAWGMLLAGWEVRIGKNCDRGLENAFSSPRSQFFTIWTDPKPVNNEFIFSSRGELARKWVCYATLLFESAYTLFTNHSQKFQ